MAQMQKVLHDVLNAGIALFRAGEDSITNAVKEVQRTYDALKEKGAADTSEPAVQLRRALDDVVTQVNDLSSKAGTAYSDGLVRLEGQYKKVIEQIQQLVPKDQIAEVQAKIDELTKVIREKVQGAGGGAGPAAPRA